jgi:integrase
MEKIRQHDVWRATPKAEKDNLRVLNPDEYFQFFSVMDNPDHVFVFKFLFGTGLRIEEARRLRIRNINMDRRELTVIKGKGGKYGSRKGRKVRFSSMLRMEIRQRIKLLKPASKRDWTMSTTSEPTLAERHTKTISSPLAWTT